MLLAFAEHDDSGLRLIGGLTGLLCWACSFLIACAIWYWIIRLAVVHGLRQHRRETRGRVWIANWPAPPEPTPAPRAAYAPPGFHAPGYQPQAPPPRGKFDIVDDTAAG